MKGLEECIRVNHLWLKSDQTASALGPDSFIDFTFSTNSCRTSSPGLIHDIIDMEVYEKKDDEQNNGFLHLFK